MTIESCQAYCTANNYALAGVEYGSQCYCSNAIASPAAVDYTGCTMTCSGNSAELCGGSSRLNLFNNTAYIYPSSPTTVGNYAYQGCYHEATVNRLLGGPSYSNNTAMTIESCVAFCSANMATGVYAGLEYASRTYLITSLYLNESANLLRMLLWGNFNPDTGRGDAWFV